MPRPEKVQAVAELQERLRRARGLVLADFRGLSVPEMETLREELRKNGVEFRVVKNTLLGIAAHSLQLQGLDAFLEGPTAVAFAYDDPTVPARIMVEFIRQYRKLEVKGGLVEGRVVDAAGVRALADLPPRSELVARVVGGIQAPLVGLVGVLTGLQRRIVSVLDQIHRQRAES